MQVRSLKWILVVHALVNATLYSLLLPLWEGFDEPFHFAYVQHVANSGTVPDTRTARLSEEVYRSLELAPASHVVQQNLPFVATYAEHFAKSLEERRRIRELLDSISPALRWKASEQENYEAHHAPLAYILLAAPERVLSGTALGFRTAMLRILAGVAGSLLLYAATVRLTGLLGIGEPYGTVTAFCVLSSQMTWATVAHVANDWLAVPLAVWMLALTIEYYENPDVRRAALAAAILSLGLLTKAYFLAFIPVVIGVVALRRRSRHVLLAISVCAVVAGPWYLRNYVLYGLISGMQETRTHYGLAETARAALGMDWGLILRSAVHGTLWTGNNVFSTFSVTTLNTVVVLGCLALILWMTTRHRAAERIVCGYVCAFLLALVYRSVIIYLDTRVQGAAPAPWFAQVLVAPLLTMGALGCCRLPRLGRWVAALAVLAFGYLLAATYFLKLIPVYSGCEGRSSLAALTRLYTSEMRRILEDLGAVALAPGKLLFALAVLAVVLIAVQQAALGRHLLRTR